ncbi:MAG: protein-L-isoaspartate O-methyltransferase [Paracoccaceae bacterium]|nr:MAG: protein-L-isoaspartate O-methyltransferase [Paracoccaceae bacterium]
MADFVTRRRMMVDTQVRPSDVTKFPIIDAMLAVPREAFVPDDRREAAYMGENLPLASGRVILEPRTLAKMLDALDLQPGDLVLDVGTGLGYSAAVVARMTEAVVAVEEDEAMAADAQRRLSDQGADNVVVVQGPLAGGVPKHAPYDAILVQGGVEVLPGAIAEQLRDGGRIACLFVEGRLGTVRIGVKQGDVIAWRHAFNALAPVLPGFAKAREFTL